MSPYGEVWQFTRERLSQAIEGLTDEQLRWRPHPEAHSIGEMLYHMAGSEHWFGSRLAGLDPSPTAYDSKLDACVRDGFLNASPFPFTEGETTLASALAALEAGERLIRPVMEAPDEQALTAPVETPLGLVVPGVEGLWRVAQHAAYHTGQIWLYRTDPRFPA